MGRFIQPLFHDWCFSFGTTSHALFNITENITKALDEGNTGCGVFVDLQKVFDTVVHQIQLGKLNHYGICGVLNDWFKSYPSNRSQYVSIDVYGSGFAALNCGVPQGSVLGLPADDTDLLRLNNSIKKLNRLVNADLKHLVNWLNAN